MVVNSIQRNTIFFFCLFLTYSISSQNLLKNPSFEQYDHCPKRLGNFDVDVVAWSTPTAGSTDYFNACSTSMGTPENFNGEQPAEFGTGYAGLYLYAPDDYREYLQAELTAGLEKGKEYQVSFFVSLAERSDFAIKEFGVLFAKDKLKIPIKKTLSKSYWYRQVGNKYNYMEIGYSNFYDDTHDWVPVSTSFVAKGGEKYMILGNFKNNARTRKFKIEYKAKQGAYYYVDAVEVKIAQAMDMTPEKNVSSNTDEKMESFALDKIHVFKNVLFDFDHFDILEPAKSEIRYILTYLTANPDMNIVIHGHTDTIGTYAYNKQLSLKRAKAVADYLVELGLAKKRITWQGFGSEKPLIANDSETGRSQNRRVEFIISNPNTP